jgi:pimeloyl-ACP methyl ester carboxylesterase
MDALDVPRAVLVGHCMGSFVARKLYELAPGRVARLVLLAAGPTASNGVITSLLEAVNQLTDPVDESFVREFQMGTVHAPVPASFMEAVIANSRRMPARIWRSALLGLLNDEVHLSTPSVPTLVLGGRQDSVFSVTEHMVLARQFPRGELQLVDGVGHSLHWEMPETFVSALIRFGV